MRLKARLAVALALGLLTTGAMPSQAALIVGQAQINTGNVAPSPITAVAGDLLETSVASFSGENANAKVRNGTTGTALENTAGINPAQIWGQTTTTYNLNTSVNTLGYDITSVNVFSGWRDDRSDQSYRLFVSYVGDANFVQVGGDIIAAVTGNVGASILTRTYDSTGAAFATGVDAIRFVQFDGPSPLDGTQTVYREFDVIGTATQPIPEPATAALGLMGVAGLMLRRRRNA